MDDEWIEIEPFFGKYPTPKKGQYRHLSEDVAKMETVNDGMLVQIRETDIEFWPDGGGVEEMEMTDIMMFMVVPRGLWILQINNLYGVQGFVWKLGLEKAMEVLDNFDGDEIVEMALNNAGGGIEHLLFQELYLAPHQRTVSEVSAGAKELAKAIGDGIILGDLAG